MTPFARPLHPSAAAARWQARRVQRACRCRGIRVSRGARCSRGATFGRGSCCGSGRGACSRPGLTSRCADREPGVQRRRSVRFQRGVCCTCACRCGRRRAADSCGRAHSGDPTVRGPTVCCACCALLCLLLFLKLPRVKQLHLTALRQRHRRLREQSRRHALKAKHGAKG